jgi:multimeric flavodoxin WrbA
MFKRKVGAVVVAVRRMGAVHVFDPINHIFLISQMIIAGSSYWNIGMGLHEKDVEKDAAGKGNVTVYGTYERSSGKGRKFVCHKRETMFYDRTNTPLYDL